MPINLNVGGAAKTSAELQQEIDLAEAEYAQQATPEVVTPPVEPVLATGEAPTSADLLETATGASPDPFLSEYNADAVNQSVIDNFGGSQEVQNNPVAYDNATKALRAATGNPDATLILDMDTLPGSGPLGQRTGGLELDEKAKLEQSRELQGDLGTLSTADLQSKHKFEQTDRAQKAGVTQPMMIDSYKNFSTSVSENVDRLNRNMNSVGKKGLEAEITKSLEGDGYKPNAHTVSQVVNGIITNRAYAMQNGVPRAFSDILLAAYLTAGKRSYTAMLQKEQDALDGKTGPLSGIEAAEDLDLSTATDGETGRMINEAMGLKGDPESNAIMGAIARKVVGETLGSEGRFKKAPLFESKQRTVAEKDATPYTKKYNAQQITHRGIKAYDIMLPLIEKILPAARKTPRNRPKAFEPTFKKARRGTKDTDFGSFQKLNQWMEVMESTPASFDFDVNDPMSVGGFMYKYRDTKTFGEIMKYEYNADGSLKTIATDEHGNPELDRRSGREVDYMPNKTRKAAVDAEFVYLNENGTKPVYFDYFIGSNMRGYVDATVGNWQSQKLPRAILQSASKITYDLNNPALIAQLEAGIMKKLGSVGKIHYDKAGVMVAARNFDALAAKWDAIKTREEQGDVAAGEELLAIAKEGEGTAGVSAILEAVKLYRAKKAHKASKIGVAPGLNPNVSGSIYTSKFLTEIDGVANGVAHSAMQGGNDLANINRATNLFSDTDLQRLQAGEVFKDVYVMTADGMLDFVEAMPDSKLGDLLKASGMINRAMGKKPMMVFGYGAGKATIKDGVAAYVDAYFKDNPGKLTEITDNTETDLETIQIALGDAAVAAVNKEFETIKIVNTIMRELAELASASGIIDSLSLPTYYGDEGHQVPLGQAKTDITAEDKGFGGKRPEVKYGKDSEGIKGRTERAVVRERKTDFHHTDEITYIDKNGKEQTKHVLKAGSQAGVKGIHAMDAINLIESFLAMNAVAQRGIQQFTGGLGEKGKPIITRGKAKGKYVKDLGYANAFQVFDGVLMPPKHAQAWATQLNNDFYDINAKFSLVEQFAQKIEAMGVTIPGELNQMLAKVHAARVEMLKKLKRENVHQFFWDL